MDNKIYIVVGVVALVAFFALSGKGQSGATFGVTPSESPDLYKAQTEAVTAFNDSKLEFSKLGLDSLVNYDKQRLESANERLKLVTENSFNLTRLANEQAQISAQTALETFRITSEANTASQQTQAAAATAERQQTTDFWGGVVNFVGSIIGAIF